MCLPIILSMIGGTIMLIDVIFPQKHNYFKILRKTKQFYGLAKSSNMTYRGQKYCVFIRKHNIRFCVFEYDERVKNDINQYLEFLFKNSYIGINEENEIITPKNVQVYKL